MNIKISSGNSKMGKISSISLPAVLTCRDGCLCKKKCYSLKLEKLRPSVKNAYYKNYYILKENINLNSILIFLYMFKKFKFYFYFFIYT